MIKFVDIRSADIPGYRFSFWDTVKDEYVVVGGDEAWEDWAEFDEGYWHSRGDTGGVSMILERYRDLCPEWVFKKADG